MTWWIAVFLMQAPLTQSPQAQVDRVSAAMAESLASQRASVRRQVEAAGPAQRVSGAVPLAAAICDAISQPELVRMIDVAARHEDVDPLLVREVARQESGFRPCAVSPKGAEGLMQLMPATQMQLQVQNPFSAEESLEAGSKLLKQLLDRYHGDLSQALSAYNAGPARVDAAGGVPKIPETQNYVSNILNRLLPALDIRTSDIPDSDIQYPNR
jgi:soluble lytic murein transglycosylase-like protein